MIKQKTKKFWGVEIKWKPVIVDQAAEVRKSVNAAATRNMTSKVCYKLVPSCYRW